ncbi:hypothetical protein I552_2106 [Mycobacterium xenopi 3993]|nr:hypothetical protein I552_2106 [Mycobacterium xenopi 3993]
MAGPGRAPLGCWVVGTLAGSVGAVLGNGASSVCSGCAAVDGCTFVESGSGLDLGGVVVGARRD